MRRVAIALALVLGAACTTSERAPDPATVNPEAARIIAATTDCAQLSAMNEQAYRTFQSLDRAEKVGRIGDLQQATLTLTVDRMEEIGCP